MTNPITQHLTNLKFYSKYRKSQAETFDQYVEFIDSGAPDNFNWTSTETKPEIEIFEFDDQFLGDIVDQKTENKIEGFLEKERRDANKPKLNLEDWYFETEFHIEYLLKKINFKIVISSSTFEVLNKLLEEYNLLKQFISNSENDFFTYTNWMQEQPAEDFFLIFSEKNKNIQNYPLIKCFPRIFKSCKEYKFFLLLTEELKSPRADLSFIFHRMKSDKLIHYHCKLEFQELIDDKFQQNYTLYNKDKTSNKFTSTYSDVFNILY